MTDTTPSPKILEIAAQIKSEEGGIDKICQEAPDMPHPEGGTFKEICNACSSKEEPEICVAKLIDSFTA